MTTYDLNPYGFKLWITANPKDLKYFKTRDGESLIYDPNKGFAVTYRCKKINTEIQPYGYVIILNPDVLVPYYYKGKWHLPNLVNVLAHEATHVALMLFCDCDIIIDEESQECEAYLIGYITGRLMDYINNIKYEEDEKTRGGTIFCP